MTKGARAFFVGFYDIFVFLVSLECACEVFAPHMQVSDASIQQLNPSYISNIIFGPFLFLT